MDGVSKIMCDEPVLRLKNESGTESIHYPILYEGFPEEFKQIAENELNETNENRQKGLHRLRDFLTKENLTFLEDDVLLAVLRSCKFNLKKSETKLRYFLKKRQDVIQMLTNVDTEKIENIIDDFCVGVLSYRDKHGRAIIYTRPYGLNLEKYEMQDVGIVMTAAIIFILKYPITSVVGYVYFGECKSPSLYLFYPIFKGIKSLMFHIFSFPAKISRVEVFNENYLCHWFYKVIAPFVKKKILNRVTLHGYGYENLHKLYDPNILPEEFGGRMGPLKNDSYRQKFLDFVMELKNENY